MNKKETKKKSKALSDHDLLSKREAAILQPLVDRGLIERVSPCEIRPIDYSAYAIRKAEGAPEEELELLIDLFNLGAITTIGSAAWDQPFTSTDPVTVILQCASRIIQEIQLLRDADEGNSASGADFRYCDAFIRQGTDLTDYVTLEGDLVPKC